MIWTVFFSLPEVTIRMMCEVSLSKVRVGNICWSPHPHGSSNFIMKVNQVGQISIHKYFLLHMPRNNLKVHLYLDFCRNQSNVSSLIVHLFIFIYYAPFGFLHSVQWRLFLVSLIPHRDFWQTLPELCMHLVWSQGPGNIEISLDIHYSNLPTWSNLFPS